MRRYALALVCGVSIHAAGCSDDSHASAANDRANTASDGGGSAGTVPTLTGPVVLASGQQVPFGLTVDSQNVYWMNRGHDNTVDPKVSALTTGAQVMKCAIAGCNAQPTVLASDRQIGPGQDTPLPLVTDGQNVYWSDQTIDADGLHKCAVGGCNNTPTKVGPMVWGLAVHAGRVYWTEFEATVNSCAISGCDGTMHALWSAGNTPVSTGIAVDDSGVYWATAATDSIRKCGLDSCNNSPTVLDPTDPISADLRQIALDSDNVYFANGNPIGMGAIMVCPKSGCTGTPTVLAPGLSSPKAIATDGLNVYWTEWGDTTVNGQIVANVGRVRKCPVTGCANGPTTIAAGVNYPTAIAVDAHFVYWTEQGASETDGKIMMAPK